MKRKMQHIFILLMGVIYLFFHLELNPKEARQNYGKETHIAFAISDKVQNDVKSLFKTTFLVYHTPICSVHVIEAGTVIHSSLTSYHSPPFKRYLEYSVLLI